MSKHFFLTLVMAASSLVAGAETVTIGKDILMDKIMGAWAAQTIGCAYGGPTEFKYKGHIIPDDVAIEWNDERISYYFDHAGGLYDDVYMDLTFLQVLHDKGIDAPASEFAKVYADAPYPLWHANQTARYNIQRGIMPPHSGHWRFNPHADDIDYQIEADYAGIICPGMPNAASRISDKVGHIMNYGDGWYGGIFVGAMYSLAYVSNDIPYIVREALRTIPAKSRFHKAMADVIEWHTQYPTDWKKTWQLVQDRYADEVGCPEGVKADFNIDALINSAYIVIGLLYGEGDFSKTLDIATRCGQDSDCNPASAGGILGCILGYNHIPSYWLKGLQQVEDRHFAFTNISLKQTYEYSMQLATQLILNNGGKDLGNNFAIRLQKPKTVRYEVCFPAMKVTEVQRGCPVQDFCEKTFTGTGYVVTGNIKSSDPKYVAEIETILDGKSQGVMRCPADFHDRTTELSWRYELRPGSHSVTLRWLNPKPDVKATCHRFIIYGKK